MKKVMGGNPVPENECSIYCLPSSYACCNGQARCSCIPIGVPADCTSGGPGH